MTIRVVVGPSPFDVGAEIAALDSPDIGGIGCFVGQVRGGGGLRALSLEHYPGMTERAITGIAETATRRFELCCCTVIHRVGRLLVGSPIVLVLAAAPHRQAALDATGLLIDWLKTAAPFWKREEFEDGSEAWVEARAHDDAQAARWQV